MSAQDYIDETGLDRVTRKFKSYIDQKISDAPNITIINGYNVESVDNGDGTQTLEITNGDAAITSINLALYKYQDLARIAMEGGELATRAEYVAAEEYLQTVYKNILEGGTNV